MLSLQVIKVLVMPKLKNESEAIIRALEGSNTIEKCSADHLQNLLIKHCSLVALRIRPMPDVLENYQVDYGLFLGNCIYKRVQQLRQGLLAHPKTPSTPTTPTIASSTVIH